MEERKIGKQNMTKNLISREKKAKRQSTCTKLAMMVYFMAVGAFLGFMLSEIQEQWFENSEIRLVFSGALYVFLLAVFMIFWLLNICFHELGHMIFGLMSGYEFQSIRFGNLIILKTEDGFKMGKNSLAGTAGQCLMKPPKGSVENYPTTLYNMGGCIVNGVLMLGMLLGGKSVAALICLMGAFIGLGVVLLNGIPISSLSNDGYNTLILCKSGKARKAFWYSLEINNALAKGIRYAEMPEEWFAWEKCVTENNLETAQGINYFSYLMMAKEYEKAKEIGQYIMENAVAMADIHSKMLKADLLFCCIMLDSDKIREIYKKEEKNFKKLGGMLDMQRTNYAYALLVEKDEKQAQMYQEKFQALAEKFPYPAEIEAEQELLHEVEEKYQK
ncbi:MAG: M50 family metallopeptidase [Lachnospiraceae bacterium]|nr:M50 family metallopeptidase [Lachnospiraceae bacterium]